MLANRTCFRDKDSILVLDEDSSKDFFLMGVFSSKTKFWLGLQYDGTAGFTNWAPGQPDYRVGTCAYMQQYTGF
ncbi:hypothetical protein OSTOST_16661, partial [Ostertagia ostertagi]